MIQIQATGKCAGCPFLLVDTLYVTELGPESIREIDCKRRDFCDRLEACLREAIAREQSEATP